MTPAQLLALNLCNDDGLTETGRVVCRVRRDVLQRLEDGALIRYRPYARVPRWTLTRYGRAAIRRAAVKAAT